MKTTERVPPTVQLAEVMKLHLYQGRTFVVTVAPA